MVNSVFIECCKECIKLIENKNNYILIYEPLMFVSYTSNKRKYELFSDVFIPDALKSTIARFLLTKKLSKYSVTLKPLSYGRVINPIQKNPNAIINELLTLAKVLINSRTYSEFFSMLNDNDKKVMEKIGTVRKPLHAYYPYVLLSRHKKAMERVKRIYVNIMKDLLVNYLGLKPGRVININSWRFIYYPLVYNVKESTILRCLKKAEIDNIYTKFINIFNNELKKYFGLP